MGGRKGRVEGRVEGKGMSYSRERSKNARNLCR